MPDWTDVTIRLAVKALWYAATHEWPRSFVEPDSLPPPTGFSSWRAYFALEGVTSMDYLPLGPPAPEGAKATMVWARTGEDVATLGMHFVHANPDVVGDTIAWEDAANSATIEGLITTLWDALKPHYFTDIALDRIDWHHFGVGIRRPNPAFLQTVLTPDPGTSSTEALPPQAAISVTFKTDKRKSWGRGYMPAPTLAAITSDGGSGRIDTTLVDDVRTAFGTLLDGAAAAHLPLVVWCPRHDGNLLQFSAPSHDGDAGSAHALRLDEPDTTSVARGVASVQVDDIFDVVRRRRFSVANVKATHTLGA